MLAGDNKINADSKLQIRRCHSGINEIVDCVYDGDLLIEGIISKSRTKKVIERALKNENYYFFAGYKDGIPVTAASVEYTNDGIGRVDSVETGSKFRSNGYCRELISAVTQFHKNSGNKYLYLYSSNPTAIKIYKEAGFVELPQFDSWHASAL